LALTGTADESTLNVIKSDLLLKKHDCIFVTPERKNIRISVRKVAKNDMFAQLSWLIELIKVTGRCCPKTLIFCNTLNDIAAVFNYLMLQLGASAYNPPESKKSECRIIGIYHSNSFKKQKERLFIQLKGTGNKRVVVASSALGMGVNFPDIKYVINWGPARNLLDQLQEGGRAGRNGTSAHMVIIYHGQHLTHCNQDVKDFVNTTGCYRVAAYSPFDPSILPGAVKHDCCNYCCQSCQCTEEGCPVSFAFDKMLTTTAECSCVTSQAILTRSVSDQEKNNLRDALQELVSQINMGRAAVFDMVSTHGFSAQLISDIVDNSYRIFTVNDILTQFPVFSITHAYRILDVLQELFMDIPDSNFEETVDHTDIEQYHNMTPFEETLKEYFDSICELVSFIVQFE
jgi:ATP-dependent DNA helicase RecQ